VARKETHQPADARRAARGAHHPKTPHLLPGGIAAWLRVKARIHKAQRCAEGEREDCKDSMAGSPAKRHTDPRQ